MKNQVLLSVIVPLLNEEANLEDCVYSLLDQDYPMDQVEILLVDGGSQDRTCPLSEELAEKYPGKIFLLHNPKKIQAAAMNIGIEAARGEVIMRVDAHSNYPKNYFSACVELLKSKGAENVGGCIHSVAKTEKGQLIAEMLSSKFAVGGSSFRGKVESGYVDTVPFGTFRKTYLQEIGGFDERLDRNEDNEINYRIRKRGDKIYMSADVSVDYYCRDSIRALMEMAFANGKWTVIATKYCPGSMSLKYFVPLVFVLSLLVLPLLSLWKSFFGWILLPELLLYFGLSFTAAYSQAKSMSKAFRMLGLFPAFHAAYGVGSLVGIVACFKKE